MIKTRFASCCNDCADLDPVVGNVLRFNGRIVRQIITCSNIDGCEAICKKAKEEVIEKHERTTTE